MTKILLLSVSVGSGHVRAAEALRAAAGNDANLTVKHLDVMNFMPGGIRKLHTEFYIGLVNKHPTLWGHLYQLTYEAQPNSSMQKLRRVIGYINNGALFKEIARFDPDVIICTHFLPAEILSNSIGKARLHCPVWVQVTDFGVHRMWVQKHMSGYFAANEEVRFRLASYGVELEKIHVSGIPVMPAFGLALNRQACAAQFGLDPRRRIFLLMGGGAGLGGLDAVAAGMLEFKGDFQLIVLAGKNIHALSALQVLAQRHPGRVYPFGFCDQIERLMACADLVITKPGGLTTSECLAMGLPMILNAPIPGQEERNADYLLEQGVALTAPDDVTLRYRIDYLLAHPGKLADMRRCAHALGRPDAASNVLATVLAKLLNPAFGASQAKRSASVQPDAATLAHPASLLSRRW